MNIHTPLPFVYQIYERECAFPSDSDLGPGGISRLEYHIAHCPDNIPPWFQPDYPEKGSYTAQEIAAMRYFQWRIYYAKQIINYL